MKTKKIALMVIIFSCVTCVFLSQGAQACWTPEPYSFECGFKCCTQRICNAPGERYECFDCKFNPYCVVNPFYCCVSALAVCGDGAKLDVLREMRDIRMARTVLGRSLIKLYYKHSLEMTSILLADEELLSFVTPVVSEIAEKAIAFNNYEKVSIDREFVDNILEVADLINEKASPELKAAIQRVKKQIKSGYIFRNFGISVND